MRGCLQMCSGDALEFEEKQASRSMARHFFVRGWRRINDITDPVRIGQDRAGKGRHPGSVSRTCWGYPFVAEGVDAGRITLHGLWTDLAEMDLETFDGSVRHFVKG